MGADIISAMQRMDPQTYQAMVGRIMMVGSRQNEIRSLIHHVERAFKKIHESHFTKEAYGNRKWPPSKRAAREGGTTLRRTGDLFMSATSGLSLQVTARGMEFFMHPAPGPKMVHELPQGEGPTIANAMRRTGNRDYAVIQAKRRWLAIPLVDEVHGMWPSEYPGWQPSSKGTVIKKRSLSGRGSSLYIHGGTVEAWKLVQWVRIPTRPFLGIADSTDHPIMQAEVQKWGMDILRKAYMELQKHGTPKYMRGGA